MSRSERMLQSEQSKTPEKGMRNSKEHAVDMDEFRKQLKQQNQHEEATGEVRRSALFAEAQRALPRVGQQQQQQQRSCTRSPSPECLTTASARLSETKKASPCCSGSQRPIAPVTAVVQAPASSLSSVKYPMMPEDEVRLPPSTRAAEPITETRTRCSSLAEAKNTASSPVTPHLSVAVSPTMKPMHALRQYRGRDGCGSAATRSSQTSPTPSQQFPTAPISTCTAAAAPVDGVEGGGDRGEVITQGEDHHRGNGNGREGLDAVVGYTVQDKLGTSEFPAVAQVPPLAAPASRGYVDAFPSASPVYEHGSSMRKDYSGFRNPANDCYACSVMALLLKNSLFRHYVVMSPIVRARSLMRRLRKYQDCLAVGASYGSSRRKHRRQEGGSTENDDDDDEQENQERVSRKQLSDITRTLLNVGCVGYKGFDSEDERATRSRKRSRQGNDQNSWDGILCQLSIDELNDVTQLYAENDVEEVHKNDPDQYVNENEENDLAQERLTGVSLHFELCRLVLYLNRREKLTQAVDFSDDAEGPEDDDDLRRERMREKRRRYFREMEKVLAAESKTFETSEYHSFPECPANSLLLRLFRQGVSLELLHPFFTMGEMVYRAMQPDVQQVESTGDTDVSPAKAAGNIVSDQLNNFFCGEQEDAHEFFVTLVAKLEAEDNIFTRNVANVLKRKGIAPHEGVDQPLFASSSINNLIQGELLNIVRCQECLHEIVTRDSFVNISLPIPDPDDRHNPEGHAADVLGTISNSEREKKESAVDLDEYDFDVVPPGATTAAPVAPAPRPARRLTLSRMLHDNIQQYNALQDYKCDDCGARNRTQQGGCFFNTPPTLLFIQIKRFQTVFVDNRVEMVKDSTMIYLEKTIEVFSLRNTGDSAATDVYLDEQEKRFGSAIRRAECDGDSLVNAYKSTYRLSGIVRHLGTNMFYGHYVTDFYTCCAVSAADGGSESGGCRGVWRTANDGRVVEHDDALDRTATGDCSDAIPSSDGYLLLYERTKLEEVRVPVYQVLPNSSTALSPTTRGEQS